jgi:hypothetical protein
MVTSLYIDWRHVLFANWPADPELLGLGLLVTIAGAAPVFTAGTSLGTDRPAS